MREAQSDSFNVTRKAKTSLEVVFRGNRVSTDAIFHVFSYLIALFLHWLGLWDVKCPDNKLLRLWLLHLGGKPVKGKDGRFNLWAVFCVPNELKHLVSNG